MTSAPSTELGCTTAWGQTQIASKSDPPYISGTITEKTFWAPEWCVSFKHTLMPRWPLNFVKTTPLAPGTKVVCFTGKPDPDEARDGWMADVWYKQLYKRVLPTPWIAEHWR